MKKTIILLSIFINVLCYSSVIRIGVPKDVHDQYVKFLNGKDPLKIKSFKANHANRDVVELTMLLQILKLSQGQYKIVHVDSYQRGISLVENGDLDVYANSIWYGDAHEDKVRYSLPLINDGEFVVGIYVKKDSPALSNMAIEVEKLKFISNKAWTRDWKTLSDLKIKKVISTPTWESMLRMIKAKRADAMLASFPNNESLVRHEQLEDLTLMPIPKKKVIIHGSRHWIVTQGKAELFKKINSGIRALRNDGLIFKAYVESGFYNKEVQKWKPLKTKISQD